MLRRFLDEKKGDKKSRQDPARLCVVVAAILVFSFLLAWLFVPYDEGLTTILGPADISNFDTNLWMDCQADKKPTVEAPFAVVVPMLASQTPRALDQLLSWGVYPPCQEGNGLIDLYYYFDRPLDLPEVYHATQKIEDALSDAPKSVVKCFRNIRFISANLTLFQTTNSYALHPIRTHIKTEGTVTQFYNLLLSESQFKREGYRYFFYMEPDTRPVLSFWLDAIYSEVSSPNLRYWVRGSVVRYGKPLLVGFLPYRQQYLYHINGNAIYRLDDPCFLNYLSLVKKEYGGYAFDLAIHYHRYSPRNYLLYQYIAHRWEYTDVIADLSRWPMPEHLPSSTYLVHGTYLVESLETLQD